MGIQKTAQKWLGLFFFMFILLALIKHGPGHKKSTAGNVKPNGHDHYEEGYVSDGGEVGPTVAAGEGDPGIDEEGGLSVGSVIPVAAKAQSKAGMVEFIIRYLGHIPYADGGRFYGPGYFKSPDGVNGSFQPSAGMDSLGYVVWVYRNVFGSCSEVFLEPGLWPGIWQPTSVDGLEISDIGLLQEPSAKQNHFGIFIGYERNFPVFAHCSGEAAPDYPCGNDRLSFLKTATNSYYMGNAPVEFHYFFRPAVSWEVPE